MKAIETIYKGYKFRSRLEARWAVFLDELGWNWEYEKEGFILDDGAYYLPDFFIPQLNTWLEVKPDIITDEDIRKVKLLSKGFGQKHHVAIVNGLPAPIQYKLYYNGEGPYEVTFTTYIKSKGWNVPYFNGDWWEHDMSAFSKAKMSRFEHGQKG